MTLTTTNAAPRWLTEEQQRIWLSYLKGVHKLEDQLDRELRQYGLSLAEYEIFVALSEADLWRMRMSDLAEAVHQSRSRLTHTVARLEKDGYVERIACPSDRRGVWAQLTSTGHELLEKAAPSHVASVRHALVDAVDPEDFRALGRVFDAVLAVADIPAQGPSRRSS